MTQNLKLLPGACLSFAPHIFNYQPLSSPSLEPSPQRLPTQQIFHDIRILGPLNIDDTPFIMADVASAPVANPQSPVPLDTIPISPADSKPNGARTDNAEGVEYVDTDPVTVFHDPENFNVKHPLMNTWTLWFTKPPSGKVCSVGAVSHCAQVLTCN